MRRLHRRTMLAGLGSALATVPFLRAIPSVADGAPLPTRVIFFITPNDAMNRQYWQVNGGADGSALVGPLPVMLSPLDPWIHRLLVVGDLKMYTRDKETGSGGHVGYGHQLTGVVNSLWPDYSNENEYWGGGISLDQFLAAQLGCQVLNLAAVPYGNNGGSRCSYHGRDEPAHPIEDPAAAFTALFGNAGTTVGEQLASTQRQLRALDHVALELERLRPRLASDDRPKMDKHLEHLLALQTAIEGVAPADCDPIAPDAGYDASSPLDFPITARRHIDVMVQALACGVTRVALLQNGNTGNAESYSGGQLWPSEGIDFPVSQHVISHDFEVEPDDAEFYARRLAIEQFYMRQLAYLLAALDAVPEGDGTLLDNTLVVCSKGQGRGHSSDRLLYLLAGGAGFPTLGPGRYLAREGVAHNDILVTIAQLVGVDIDSFGDPEICTGAMPL